MEKHAGAIEIRIYKRIYMKQDEGYTYQYKIFTCIDMTNKLMERKCRGNKHVCV